MKKLLDEINNKIQPYKVDKYLFSKIIQDLYFKLHNCYEHQLKNILSQEQREKKICELVHIHCYNKTITTKSAIKKTLKNLLSDTQYKNFGLKLIYAILDVGSEITDDPYSPECSVTILTEELRIMNVDPKLEAIALKVMDKMNLSKDGKDGKYGSIIVVIMIIGIILSLIRVIQECNKTQIVSLDQRSKARFIQKQVKDMCISRTFLNNWRLKRIIKQKLSADDYKLYAEKLKNAILDCGPELTEEESFTLVEAANV